MKAPMNAHFQKGYVDVGCSMPSHSNGKTGGKPVRLYYERTGSGPIKLLLIIGLGTPASAWDPVVEYFSKRPEYTTVIFDNRGAGFSDAPAGLYSTSQMAKDALDLLDALGWHEDVNVAGLSMGGMISLELALADPKRISSLTLTSTNAGRAPPQLVTVAFMLRVITILDPELRIKFIAEHFYPKVWLEQPAPQNSPYKTNLQFMTTSLKKQYIETPFQPLHGNIAHCWAALTHYVSAPRLARLRASGIPILVVTGTEDNFVRPSGSYYLQQQLGCKLAVFEGSGHIVPSERTTAYCKLIEELIHKGKEGQFEI